MIWNDDVLDGALRRRRFTLEAGGRLVPGVLWTPAGATAGRRPLVLVGHGGSQHKESDAVLDVARPLVGAHGFAVAAIDGPVHGARRADGGTVSGQVIAEFRALWDGNPGIEDMVADWRAALDALAALPEVDPSAIGWFGLSMGTAYGLPLCAQEPRIRAALLGMWGTSHAHGDRMLAHARNVRCPVLFQRKRDDERFTPAGQQALFDALASHDKELRVYEGGHVNPVGPQLDEGLGFLVERVAAAQGAVR
jgi:dienelactone hydrolase